MPKQSSTIICPEQSNYSDQIYKESLLNIRTRIDFLSNTNSKITGKKSSSTTFLSEPQILNKPTHLTGKMCNLNSDCSILRQKITLQILDMKKSQSYLSIVKLDLEQHSSSITSQLNAKLTQFNQDFLHAIQIQTARTQALFFQCTEVRNHILSTQKLLDHVQSRVRKIENQLGVYTALEKITSSK